LYSIQFMIRMKPNHDKEFIFDALKLLELHSFNYSVTAQELGITRQTLSKWHKTYGQKKLFEPVKAKREGVHKGNPDNLDMKASPALAGAGPLTTEESFNDDAHELKVQTLEMMKKLVPKTKNLDVLTRTLKALHDINMNPGGTGESEASGNTRAFIQLIQNQVIIKNREQKNS